MYNIMRRRAHSVFLRLAACIAMVLLAASSLLCSADLNITGGQGGLLRAAALNPYGIGNGGQGGYIADGSFWAAGGGGGGSRDAAFYMDGGDGDAGTIAGGGMGADVTGAGSNPGFGGNGGAGNKDGGPSVPGGAGSTTNSGLKGGVYVVEVYTQWHFHSRWRRGR